ncbi:MAG: dioxygenase [Acidobacteria bacterium]|nr:dioxygenase [Acidobacteriota bacterium]
MLQHTIRAPRLVTWTPPPLPSLFVGHGSPTLALDGGAWGISLGALRASLPSPRAILVCSAHWETAGGFQATSAPVPGVMHDFGGFPAPLYELDYPAPGSPELAERVVQGLEGVGLAASLAPHRPLDHGAWVPLRYLASEATLPVVQLSLPRPRTPELLLAAGRALAFLRGEGVLILGSGGIVHNLGRLDWEGGVPPRPWAEAFQGWVGERVADGDFETLARWSGAPGARESVPTSEHLDPLFLALGASGGPGRPFHEGWQLGSLSLASYRFA